MHNPGIPFFSIITVNLNNKAGLNTTIASVINQTFREFELLVIDGLSSDGSIEIIRQYESFISNWISEKDNGIYHAMNKGINQARGKYCLFLNSADYLVNNSVLENVHSKCGDEDVLFGNLVKVSSGKITGRITGIESPGFIDIYNNRVKHQASFIKKELFNTYGLYNENLKIISDWEFFIKSMGFGKATSKYLNMDIAYYDDNGISNVRNPNNTSIKERQEIIEKYIPESMRADFEFLKSTYRYRELYNNPVTFFMIKVINKLRELLTKRKN